MPIPLLPLITLASNAWSLLKKLKHVKQIMPLLMKIGPFVLKNWRALLVLMIGLAFGFLISLFVKSPRIKIETVTEYITVESVKEIMPDLNCPYELIRTPKTNGELLLQYKSLIEWRAGCLNSIRAESLRLK